MMENRVNVWDKPLKLLFIGNSATYVNDIPGTLSRLAQRAGYNVQCDSVVKGGVRLAMHADTSVELGKTVLKTLENGYDIVFIQDHSNCISSAQMRLESQKACETLGAAIRASGARTGIYFRPPTGFEMWGLTPIELSREYDRHFLKISESVDSVNVFVNRAFAYAIRHTDYDLWGADRGHTNKYGAYLAVCVFFSTVFNTSSSVLEANGLPLEDARVLQCIGDKIALECELPWDSEK